MRRRSVHRQVSRRPGVGRVVALLGVVVLLPVAAHASKVCPAGPPDCQFTTLQDAVDNAQHGETITVTIPDDYAGINNPAGKQGLTITAKDQNNRDNYKIVGGGGGPVVMSGSNWLLQGFTITGGLAADGGGIFLGGAATIRNCVVHDNTASGRGGGVFASTGSADLLVENSEIRDNHAAIGGGISVDAKLTIVDSQLFGNTATAFGGAIDATASLFIKGSQIQGNSVTAAPGLGGGIHKRVGGEFRIENTTINGNVSAGSGGGLRISQSPGQIIGGSITGNTATSMSSTGGGIQLGSGLTALVGVGVTNNTSGSGGGGIHCAISGVLTSYSGLLMGNNPADLGGSCANCTPPGEIEPCLTGKLGVCSAGQRVCGAIGVWGECVQEEQEAPKELLCMDTKDNDCDGLTDALDPDCLKKPKTPAEAPSSGNDRDPVSTLSGALFQSFPPDLSLGGPLEVAFSRYYASNLLAEGISGRLGDNWRHSFEWSLVDNTGTTGLVEIVSAQGRRITFEEVSGAFELREPTDVRFQLVDSGPGFTLGDPRTSLLYEFDGAGKLVSISDGTANELTLAYIGSELDTVADGLGRTLTFTHTAGNLTQVADGTRSIAFGYTGTHLTSFTDARAKTTTYAYDPGGLMTSWTLPRGNTPFSQAYDVSGRVETQTEAPLSAQPNVYDFAYDDVTGITTLTDPDGNTRRHTHSPDGELTEVENEDGLSFAMAYSGVGDKIGVTDRLGDTTVRSTHEPSGKLASITHVDGSTTTRSYSSRTVGGITFYDLSRIDYPDGTSETFFWSNSGNLLSRLDRAGFSSSSIYNDRGQPESFTNAAGGETTWVYNADGTVASRTDPSGNTTNYDYDALDRLILVTHPDTTTRSFTYDNADNLLTLTDERSNTTTFTYDDNGNLATITDPLIHTTTFAYDDVDRLLSVEDALTNTASLAYDSLGRVAGVTDREGDTVDFGYDARGRLTSVTDGAAKVWPRGWDVESVPASVTDPLGNTASFASDNLGRLTRIETPLTHATTRVFDSMGRLTRVTDPAGEVTDHTYDERGLMTGIARGDPTMALARDELGRITSITDANGQQWLQEWDDHGRLTSREDPLTQRTVLTYDNRNRVDLVTLPGSLGTITPSYDEVGNVTRLLYKDDMDVVDVDLNFTFDDVNRLTSAEGLSLDYDANNRLIDSNGLGMTRDLNGRLETLELTPGKTITYSYDPRGLLSQVTDWVAGAAGITTFTYDDASRLTAISRPNGVHTTLTWDADSRLIGMTEGVIASSTLTYDPAGKLIRADRTVPTAGGTGGVSPTSHTYDAASQVADPGFTYDALGRLTADGTRTYVWDLASRLTSVTQSPDTVTYTYDALGNRLTRTEAGVTRAHVWNYALGLPSVNVERSGSVAGPDLRYYITTPGGLLLYSREASDDSRRDYHYDHLGNTLFLTDGLGAVAASYAYDPYGQLLAAAGAADNPFTWQGGLGVMSEAGATGATAGLYYLRARYYDSGTRRFLSRDPVATLDPATVNPYQYAAGHPTGLMDPLGLQPQPEGTFVDSVNDDDGSQDALRKGLEGPVPVNPDCGPETRRKAILATLEQVSFDRDMLARLEKRIGEEAREQELQVLVAGAATGGSVNLIAGAVMSLDRDERIRRRKARERKDELRESINSVDVRCLQDELEQLPRTRKLHPSVVDDLQRINLLGGDVLPPPEPPPVTGPEVQP